MMFSSGETKDRASQRALPPAGGSLGLRGSEWLIVLIPGLLSLVLNLAFWVAFPDHLMPDSASYMAPAHSMVSSHTFDDITNSPDIARTPGYPVFLDVFYLLSIGNSKIALAQHLMLAILVGLTALSAWRLCGNPAAAFVAAILLAIDLSSILVANAILSDTLATVFVLLCAWQTYRATVSEWPRAGTHAALAGLLAGWTVMVRPAGILYGFPLALIILLGSPSRARWKSAIVGLLAFCLFPGLWVARNDRLTGHPTVTTIAAYNMLYYRAAGVLAIHDPGRFADNLVVRQQQLEKSACSRLEQTMHKPCASIPLSDRATLYSSMGMSIVRSHPRAYIEEAVHGLMELALGGSDGRIFHGNLYILPYTLPVLLLALAGLPWWYRRNRAAFWLLVLTVGYYFFIAAGAEGYARYRVPVMPLYTMLAGGGFAWIIARVWNPSSGRRSLAEREAAVAGLRHP